MNRAISKDSCADEGWARFRALLEDASASCSNAATRVHGRDRAGLLMAAALLRMDLADLDRRLDAQEA